MPLSLSRRALLLGTSIVPLTSSLQSGGPGGTSPRWAFFPSHSPELAREMVGVAHGNLPRVKALLADHPALALASWDWGFGDWETALGAASHVGNRAIAELLLEHGAAPTLFSAAMLGQLDVVKALETASPGVRRTRGPHHISLLAHARAGGDAARPVLQYLESLGDADPRPVALPLDDAEAASIAGTYPFGPGPDERFEVTLDRGQLGIERPGGTRRLLLRSGGREFHPTGVDAVKIRFFPEAGPASSLTVVDGPTVLRADRR